MERIGGCAQTVLDAGDAIIIKTPTGGGYGAVAEGAPVRD
jgi:5-oxoprolinase (ATP-hydrolysing)